MTRCQGFVGDKQPPVTLVEKSRSLLVARPDVSNIDHAAKLPRDPASPQGKCVILSLRFHDPTDSFISRRILRKVHLRLLLMGGAYMDQPIVLAQGVPSEGSHAPTPEDGPDR